MNEALRCEGAGQLPLPGSVLRPGTGGTVAGLRATLRGSCPVCGAVVPLRDDGSVRAHRR